ncbi:MAG: TFIIH complex subunit tfb5 [Trichoglossum hirsutum]|nr:MAG: TFIIH complex subunit tfb5 [Trichoglossum hirsutum]
MPKAVKGVLVECDESIRAIILKIDAVNHDFIIEDLDDHTLVVKETKLPELKRRLEEELKDTQDEPKDSGSEKD